MANIEITPINIDGVKIPSNLLDNILGQGIDYTRLVYPIDLATNPQYCHAVQFSVHDYHYPVVDANYEKLSGFLNKGLEAGAKSMGGDVPTAPEGNLGDVTSISKDLIAKGYNSFVDMVKNFNPMAAGAEIQQMWNSVQNYNLSSLPNGFINSLNTFKDQAPAELKQYLTQYGPLLQTDTYRPRVYDQPLAYISLYMPDTLETSVSSQYDDTSLTNTFKLAGYAANATADVLNNKDPLQSNPKNILPDDYRRGGLAGIAGTISEDLGKVIGNALKRVPNPQVQLLYRGLDLRTFSFNFTFTPASAKEAEEIDEIIKTFTYYSLPDVTSGVGGQFFIPPQVFRIKFAFLGTDGIAGQIYDVFRNNLTNVLGNQFTKILTGSNPTNDITNAANTKKAKIFEINDCFLTDVQVNYAPNGWASYSDGWPIQTTLSLTFKEMNLINKQSKGVQPKNTSNYVNRDNPDYVNSISGLKKQ